ncbi:MAG: alginate export family protein [Methylococcales bacterium]
MKTVLNIILFMCITSACVEAHDNEAVFSSNRWEEDFRYLANKLDKNAYEEIKYLSLTNNRDEVYLSLGGNFRERFNGYDNDLLGFRPKGSGSQFLHRFLVHADFHATDKFRAFIQFGSYLSNYDRLGTGLFDKDRVDLQQGFIDFNYKAVTARFGRQEFSLGSSRLISVREGQNVRRSFDGLRVMLKNDFLDLEGFGLEEVKVSPHSFDDYGNPDEKVWGVNSKWSFNPTKAEFYYVGLNRRNATYQRMIANEIRRSFCVRLFSIRAGWDWDFEGIYQTGSFGNLTINAWTTASKTGFTFNSLKWKPRLGLSANIASGDRNPKDKQLNTFNPLYPNLSYFEEAAILAPENFYNLNPSIAIKPIENLLFSVAWNFFWRLSKYDAVYVRGLNPLNQTLDVGGHFVTHAVTGNLEWEINKHFGIGLSYSYFFAGQVITQAGGKDADYFRAQLNFVF